MAAKNFRGWLRLKGFVAAASGYWRRLGGLREDDGEKNVWCVFKRPETKR